RKGELPPQNALLHVRKFDGEKHYLGEVAWQRELPEARGAKIVKKTFLPEKEQWIYMVKRAREIAPKVVLSRMCILELDHAPDPFAIAAALPSEGAYVFCIDDGES